MEQNFIKDNQHVPYEDGISTFFRSSARRNSASCLLNGHTNNCPFLKIPINLITCTGDTGKIQLQIQHRCQSTGRGEASCIPAKIDRLFINETVVATFHTQGFILIVVDDQLCTSRYTASVYVFLVFMRYSGGC